jgi:uncharacterized protein DUF6644
MTAFATSFATWCQHTAIAEAIRSAPWPFPVIEIFHIAGMVVVFGTILILNLRVFGLILGSEPVSQIAQDLTPLTLTGLGVQLVSGSLMFMTSAMKFTENALFGIKIGLVIAAVVYHFAIHRRVAIANDTQSGRLRLSAAVSLVLWAGVVLVGLDIGVLS